MNNKTAIYMVARQKGSGGLSISQTWSSNKGNSGFNAGYSDFTTAVVDGDTLLLAADPAAKHIDIYLPATDGSGLTLKQQNTVEIGYHALSGFTIAGVPHVVAYEPESGKVDFYRIDNDLGLTKIYSFCRTYGLVTSGWTTMQAYQYRGTMLLLGYDNTNGAVAIYQLQVTATSPLSVSCVWKDTWAKSWTRFCFFRMGGENFFLKSNTLYKHVFIDHLMDNADEGSHPVGKHLPEAFLDMSAAQTFAFDGNIFAIACKDTDATIYRIQADCQSMTEEATFDTVPDASRIVSIEQGGNTLLLVY